MKIVKKLNIPFFKMVEITNVIYVFLVLFLGIVFVSDADDHNLHLLAFVTVVWPVYFVFLVANKHTILAINSSILFWLYLVGDIITFGVSDWPVVAYTFFIMGFSFLFLLLYQEVGARIKLIAPVATILFSITLYAIPILYIVYYLNFGAYITPDIVYALMQTNVSEAMEFIRVYVDSKWLVLILISSIVLSFYLYKIENQEKCKISVLLTASLFLLSFAIALSDKTDLRIVYMLTKTISHYEDELRDFRAVQEKRSQGEIEFSANKDNEGEVYIIVIGESLNKNHMGLYGYMRNTTPRLQAKQKAGDLLVYRDVYSNHTHTMPTLSHFLTEANQRNGKSYYESLTVIDILKKAGFATSWITNQVLHSVDDNLVGVIATQSDELYRINYEFGASSDTQNHDGEMIRIVEDVLNDKESSNKVVFVHLMGNHGDYCARYPEKYSQYNAPLEKEVFGLISDNEKLSGLINCYDNSVIYNDYVVSSLIDLLASAKDNVSGLLYIPDHADDVLKNRGHNSGMFTFSMTEIPMLMWFSKGYKERYGEKYDNLKGHQEKLFSNDFAYDTLLGTMGVDSVHYERQYDLSSQNYMLDIGSTFTLHGKVPLTDKKNHKYWLFANQGRVLRNGLSDRIYPHRINSTGKLSQILNDDYRSFEFDVMFFDDSGGGHLEVGHDLNTQSHIRLDDFLSLLPMDKIEKIWFDLKNANEENIHKIHERLAMLDETYGLKNKIIVESDMTSDSFSVISDAGFHTSYYLPDYLAKLHRKNKLVELNADVIKIAEQVKRQRCGAVSFDASLYPMVKEYLEEKLGKKVIYHTWDLSIGLEKPDFFDTLERQGYYKDDRIKTILVSYYSEFNL